LITQRMQEMAAEKGEAFAPQRPDNVQRLEMGVLPAGAQIIPNPFNRIPGFSCRGAHGAWLHCVPGFPVMAWPMVAWALDAHHRDLHQQQAYTERSVILFKAQEAALTPLMQAVEMAHPGIKVFSLPSVDHPEYGLHIELGVKGKTAAIAPAWQQLTEGLHRLGAQFGPELQRQI
ncbi:MAG TPA: competence/damage-inducible protein A, partial [Comamonas denitrificans]|nr:competence/damage-inducible protein A [Comamonas denitrificans]